MLKVGSKLRSLQLCVSPRNQSSLITKAKEFQTKLEKATTNDSLTTLSPIPRHGPGDAVIILNVGGSEFSTLRSTVFSNHVLAKHVLRAENNKEIMKNGAVFIDRDPEHFGFILRYLRNRMAEFDATPKSLSHVDKTAKLFMKKMSGSKSHYALPKDEESLRELYVEVSFYEIPELKTVLGSCTYSSRIVKLFNKNATNPLEAGAKLFGRIRGLFLAVGAAGTSMVLWVQSEFETVLTRIGLRGYKTEDENENNLAS